MFIQVNDARGKPIDRCRVVLAAVGLTNPDGSLQSDDKITREGGNVAWTWHFGAPGMPFPPSATSTDYELRVNTYEPLAAYTNETRRVTLKQLMDEQQVFVLKDTSGPPVPPQPPSGGLTTVSCIYNGAVTGIGTPSEWKTIMHGIVAKLPAGAIMEPDTGPQPNLQFVNAELAKVHPWAELQHNSGGTLKPRLFPPSNNHDGKGPPESMCGQYSRPIDFGSFGLPFFHDSSGNTDVWQLTGRPPSSAW